MQISDGACDWPLPWSRTVEKIKFLGAAPDFYGNFFTPVTAGNDLPDVAKRPNRANMKHILVAT